MMQTLYGVDKDADNNAERLSDAGVVGGSSNAAGSGRGLGGESKKGWGGGLSTKVGVDDDLAFKRSETGNSSASSATGARKRRGIVDMSLDYLEKEWSTHENKIQDFMLQREVINDMTAVIDHTARDRKDSEKMSFQEFWKESCKVWAAMAILFFYLG